MSVIIEAATQEKHDIITDVLQWDLLTVETDWLNALEKDAEAVLVHEDNYVGEQPERPLIEAVSIAYDESNSAFVVSECEANGTDKLSVYSYFATCDSFETAVQYAEALLLSIIYEHHSILEEFDPLHIIVAMNKCGISDSAVEDTLGLEENEAPRIKLLFDRAMERAKWTVENVDPLDEPN